MKLTSIHKKTRGMKKKVRKLASWAEYQKQLDIESLLKYRKEYVKIWIKPFYNLHQINPNEIGRKNPTYKFRKQVLYQLIEIYLAWQKKLEQLKQPYYLKIWLADPEFMDSQVVAALEPEIEYYTNIFQNNEEHKDFPLENQHPLKDCFVWERCINGYYVWESDLEETCGLGVFEKAATSPNTLIHATGHWPWDRQEIRSQKAGTGDQRTLRARTLNKEIDLNEFESWLYEHDELEQIIGSRRGGNRFEPNKQATRAEAVVHSASASTPAEWRTLSTIRRQTVGKRRELCGCCRAVLFCIRSLTTEPDRQSLLRFHKFNVTIFKEGASITTRQQMKETNRMKRIKKATVAIMAVGALTLSAAGITNELLPAKAAAASASASSATSDYYKQALQTLNRFYKPALQGQFPGLEGLTLGKSTHEDVIKAIGEPEMPAKASNAFDFYHAEMGHPGYAISYKGNKIQEMRYFGTNVEREANIGGITVKMLVQQWGAPHSSTVFKTGSIEQKKIVYIRGAYQLEFIFNSSTNLDHINLVYKA